MTLNTLEIMLKHSRKVMLQRKNKPLAKHASETFGVGADELSEITGAKTHDGQRTWLDANRWKYHTNRAGRPIVGRMYARLKLAGIEASALTPQAWAPDFSQIG